MNIWLISKYAGLPWYGTAGARLYHLARHFAQHGHRVVLLTSDANHLATFPETRQRYNREERDGVQTCWIKTRKYKTTASVGRILSWIDFERWLFRMPTADFPAPDVVIVSSLSLLTVVYGGYLKKKYGAKLVFEVRDIWPLTMVAEGGFPRWHPLVRLLGWIERYGYRKADLVVGTMPRLDLHVREVLGHEVPFHCCPLGYAQEDLQGATEIPSVIPTESFPEGKFTVGYAGSIGLTNALDPLVESIERLSGRKDIHFVILGDGDKKKEYMGRLAGRTNVAFIPRVAKSDVPSILARCDVLYLSTFDSPVWRFGQSMNKVVEYMLAGKPVVASYSGYRSMLNEAECGVFVPSGDADQLVEAFLMFADMPRETREAMGRRGREWILRNRSYGVLAEAYLNAIRSLPPTG